MAHEILTDEEVELEIERLTNSEAVKLAHKEKQFRYRRRQYLYTLRWYEKRGKELMKLGYDLDSFDPEDLERSIEMDAEGNE